MEITDKKYLLDKGFQLWANTGYSSVTMHISISKVIVQFFLIHVIVYKKSFQEKKLK